MNQSHAIYVCRERHVERAPPVTFKGFGRGLRPVSRPWRVTVSREVSQLQVRYGQPYDGRLVQLRRDGRRQWQHFGQLVELVVLLAPARPGRVPALFLPQFQYSAKILL